MNRTTLTRRPVVAIGVGYLCLHVALIIGSTVYASGDAGALVATGGLSIAYYLLITAFGTALLAITASKLARGWWLAAGVLAVLLVAVRYTVGTAGGILTLLSLFAPVFLPYVVVAGLIARVLTKRFGGERFRRLPTHSRTRRGLFVAGVLLVATVGGSVFAVAVAPAPVPPADWPADRQLESLERTDQRDRETGAVADRSRDYRRAERVLTLLAAGRADAPEEWLDAAVVLQHGTCPEHFELAYRLATAADDSAEVDASQWVHFTYDRWQVSTGEPQRYGTQTGTLPVGADCQPPVPDGVAVSSPLAGVH